MLHPAPTTKIDPTLARGTVLSVRDATDTSPAVVVMGFPNTSYEVELETHGDEGVLKNHIGAMVLGRIYAKANRVDEPDAGGRRFDPCYGRPTRLLGTVVGVDPVANVLVINAGQPVVLSLMAPGQKATQFADAEFVVCDVRPGTAFKFEGEA